MKGRLGVALHPFDDLFVSFDLRARREFAAVVRTECGLIEDPPRRSHRLDPFATISFGGQVVELQRRVHTRVAGRDLDGAASVGVHRPDVHLVSVTTGGGAAVVANCDRQEVEHQIRIGRFFVAAYEPASLEVVGGTEASAAEQPLRTDDRPPPPGETRRDGNRLLGGVLDVDLEVILEVIANARKVRDGLDAQGLQLGGVSHARQLEQLRRIDRSAAQNHFPGRNCVRAASVLIVHPGGAGALESDPGRQRPGPDLEVGPPQHRA